MTSYPDNSFSDIYLEFDAYLPILTNLSNSKVNERTSLLEIINKYSALSPSKEFRAVDYFSFFKEHPITQLAHPQFISILTKSLLKGNEDIFKNKSIPPCFRCQNCDRTERCNFPFIIEIWGQLQAQMKSYYKNAKNNISAL